MGYKFMSALIGATALLAYEGIKEGKEIAIAEQRFMSLPSTNIVIQTPIIKPVPSDENLVYRVRDLNISQMEVFLGDMAYQIRLVSGMHNTYLTVSAKVNDTVKYENRLTLMSQPHNPAIDSLHSRIKIAVMEALDAYPAEKNAFDGKMNQMEKSKYNLKNEYQKKQDSINNRENSLKTQFKKKYSSNFSSGQNNLASTLTIVNRNHFLNNQTQMRLKENAFVPNQSRLQAKC